jgi:hypothetical protein
MVPSMPELSDTEMAALRFMLAEPLRIDPFSQVPDVEEVAAMLDGLARMGPCCRTLEGLNRVYSITSEGAEIVKSHRNRRASPHHDRQGNYLSICRDRDESCCVHQKTTHLKPLRIL